jgi:hypothetical protein
MADGRAGLLLYCIADASSALPGDGRGVRGGGLRRVAHREFAAVVSPLEDLPAPATPSTGLLAGTSEPEGLARRVAELEAVVAKLESRS